mmetsp:Transcript_9729/g.15930  ORF Transcript_9729/g.15930 Transcript_9729/m.15930 type:complete len:314 (+) Transcript_9729:324-1265(+)|eukprot:CAMPEP_0184644358 /NCGR_PEP_ID=MMETSP0308-20130426/1085_1 /TAXON_ID=38269 /ORGANISM="Gloeochaete witrockiana, Strain SAG 46.84" /LENGTH=313 /DNA_ID=CAMNT_0027072835 /DNA_START=256 /DNA_END=1197 /DNA_ORIENTATION=-
MSNPAAAGRLQVFLQSLVLPRETKATLFYIRLRLGASTYVTVPLKGRHHFLNEESITITGDQIPFLAPYLFVQCVNVDDRVGMIGEICVDLTSILARKEHFVDRWYPLGAPNNQRAAFRGLVQIQIEFEPPVNPFPRAPSDQDLQRAGARSPSPSRSRPKSPHRAKSPLQSRPKSPRSNDSASILASSGAVDFPVLIDPLSFDTEFYLSSNGIAIADLLPSPLPIATALQQQGKEWPTSALANAPDGAIKKELRKESRMQGDKLTDLDFELDAYHRIYPTASMLTPARAWIEARRHASLVQHGRQYDQLILAV